MSKEFVAASDAIKVLNDGQVEFRKGRPLKRSDIELLGKKFADCVTMGLLVSPEEFKQRERMLAMSEK